MVFLETMVCVGFGENEMRSYEEIKGKTTT